jgi:hypothetical protein
MIRMINNANQFECAFVCIRISDGRRKLQRLNVSVHTLLTNDKSQDGKDDVYVAFVRREMRH